MDEEIASRPDSTTSGLYPPMGRGQQEEQKLEGTSNLGAETHTYNRLLLEEPSGRAVRAVAVTQNLKCRKSSRVRPPHFRAVTSDRIQSDLMVDPLTR